MSIIIFIKIISKKQPQSRRIIKMQLSNQIGWHNSCNIQQKLSRNYDATKPPVSRVGSSSPSYSLLTAINNCNLTPMLRCQPVQWVTLALAPQAQLRCFNRTGYIITPPFADNGTQKMRGQGRCIDVTVIQRRGVLFP